MTEHERAAGRRAVAAGGGERGGPNPWIATISGMVIVFALAALFWPNSADGLLRILIATLVIGYVAAQASRVIPPPMRDPYSPFGRESLQPNPPAAPRTLRNLTRELRAAAGKRSGRPGHIPPVATRLVRAEASRRLARNHGLRLEDPAHHPQIRRLVSEPTWRLIGSSVASAVAGPGTDGRYQPLPLAHLGYILDDLESL